MSRLLLAFALVQGTAVAAFFWAPLSPEGRAPGDLLGWAAGVAGVFALVGWPLLEGGKAGERAGPGEEGLGVAGRGALLLLAAAPFVSVALALAPRPAGESARALLPLLGAWAAGGLLAWGVRVGGEEFGRAAAALALAGYCLGPAARMISGAAGSIPGGSVTVSAVPWLLLAAPLFAAAALLARRLRAGSEPSA